MDEISLRAVVSLNMLYASRLGNGNFLDFSSELKNESLGELE